jgi:glucose-6-phosphate 1-epimerase
MASAAPLSDLNHRFEIPGVAKIVEGHGGLPAVRIYSPEARGEIYLHGAQVTSWHPVGAEDVLFLSAKSQWKTGTAIRGGAPICFPWFSTREGQSGSPAHGVVRTKPWQLEAVTHADSNVTVALSTSADDSTRKFWPGDFHLLFCATFGEQLRLELIVTNQGPTHFHFEEALHTYFRVGNVESARLSGLNGAHYVDKTDAGREKQQKGDLILSGETDRIYRKTLAAVEIEDPALRRRIIVAKENSHDTVIWNPWTEKAKAMADLGGDAWREFVCVETANIGERAMSLDPGHRHMMAALISVNAA